MIPQRSFIATTSLAVLAATAMTSAMAEAETLHGELTAVQQIERYCVASWRNARISQQDWSDCTQQAFERLLQKIPREEMRTAIDCKTSTQRRELNRSIWATLQRWRRMPRYQSILPDGDDAGCGEENTLELREELDKACTHLTPRQNRIIKLWMAGYTPAEIAEKLDMKPARVSDEKYKALRTLRQHIQDPCLA